MEKKYIRGVPGRASEVIAELKKAGGHFGIDTVYDNFDNPAILYYICDGTVIRVEEDSDHGKLLKSTCSEVSLSPKWLTPLTESEKGLVEKIGDYIQEHYGEVGVDISRKIKLMGNFCRCTECKHFAIYYDDYNSNSCIPRYMICEKTNKELSYEDSNGSVGCCHDYEPKKKITFN